MMKDRTSWILLAAFLLTADFYGLVLLAWLDIIPLPFFDPDDPTFLPLSGS